MAKKKHSKNYASVVAQDTQGFYRSSRSMAFHQELSRAFAEASLKLFNPADSYVHDIMAALDQDVFLQVQLAISDKVVNDHLGDEEVKKIATLRMYAYFIQVGVILESNRCKDCAEQKQKAA